MPVLYLLLCLYALFLCCCVYAWHRTKKEKLVDDVQIDLSVVICARNEEKNIGILLRDLDNQSYKAKEIIIVDDNSEDKTAEIVSSFSNVRLIQSTGNGKKQALKCGIEAAMCDIIVCTDADCHVPSTWLQAIASSLVQREVTLLIAPVRMKSDTSFWQQIQMLEFLSLVAVTAGSAVIKQPMMCNGANLIFNRNVWLKAYDYLHLDEPSGDDMFFLMYCKKHNEPILYLKSQEAMISVEPNNTFVQFRNQRRRWVSKSKSYRDVGVIFIGLLTFAVTVMPVFLLCFGLWMQAFICWGGKTLADALFVLNFAPFFKGKQVVNKIIPLAMLYPFYVLYVTVSGLCCKVKWK
jgi:glycosyltransferase involved in cell wall biosynthesis